MSTLSSNLPRSTGPTISPTLRTSAVTFPRQLAPTVGPALAGVELIRGALQGMEGFGPGRTPGSRLSLGSALVAGSALVTSSLSAPTPREKHLTLTHTPGKQATHILSPSN